MNESARSWRRGAQWATRPRRKAARSRPVRPGESADDLVLETRTNHTQRTTPIMETIPHYVNATCVLFSDAASVNVV